MTPARHSRESGGRMADARLPGPGTFVASGSHVANKTLDSRFRGNDGPRQRRWQVAMARPAFPPRVALVLLLAMLATAFSGCAHPARTDAAGPLHDAGQLVLVTTPEWNADHGTLRRFERRDGAWHAVGDAAPVMVGRNGTAWGLGLHPAQPDGPVKREGDGRAPAGAFAIGTAFGYPGDVDTALPYAAMDAGDWCIDVPASPLYNRIVDARDVGADAVEGSTEPMRRDLHADGDQRYRLGFVIEHNARAIPGAGSCIFAHLWKSPRDATAGCTAMADPVMLALLDWIDPAHEPVFVLLPLPEYHRLQPTWQLPVLEPDA